MAAHERPTPIAAHGAAGCPPASSTSRQLAAFTVVGGVQYVVDLSAFWGLTAVLGSPVAANVCSRLLGAMIGYYLNGVFTFGVLGRRRGPFSLRFAIAWLVMTGVSTGLIKLATHVLGTAAPQTLIWAKGAIELVLFVAGFVVCKWFVFAAMGGSEGAGDNGVARPGTGGSNLFALAHHDDEVFFLPSIRAAVARGDRVVVCYLTDGSARGSEPSVRIGESLRALGRLGVPSSRVYPIGVELGVRDQTAHLHLRRLHAAMQDALKSHGRFTSVFVHAWEGGHGDHDAAHLVGIAMAQTLGVGDVYECPGYHAAGIPRPFFRAFSPARPSPDGCERRLTLAEGLWFFSFCALYPSQWRTFVGLAPFAFWQFVVRRRHHVRPVPLHAYDRRPHPGPLLYERRFGLSFQEFQVAAAEFVAELSTRLTANPELASPSGAGRRAAIGNVEAVR